MSLRNAIGRCTDVRSCRDWGIKATCNLLICAGTWLYINTGLTSTCTCSKFEFIYLSG